MTSPKSTHREKKVKIVNIVKECNKDETTLK